jgi:hypothetical protein
MRRNVRNASVLAVLLTIGALAVTTASSLAASAAVNVGTGSSGTPPSIVVDPGGTAYIVWTTPADTAINYCKLPVGAKACASSSTISLTGGSAIVTGGNPEILFDGATLIVLADVTTDAPSEGDGGMQEWTAQSPYTSFTPALGGAAVNFVGEDAGPIGAVVLPGGAPNNLGVAWEVPGGAPQFEETPFTPIQQSQATTPEPAHATLDPGDSLKASNGGGAIASQLGSNPGVLGVVNTIENPPCNTFGIAYAYAAGAPSPASYDLSANIAGSAWQSGPLAQLDCHASHPAVGGGPSGFGVLEQDEAVAPNATVYRRFDETSGKFDLPTVTISRETEQFPSLSQDAAGSIYATWLGSGGIRVATGAGGGASWSTAETLDRDPAVNDLTSGVGSAGQGWASWVDASGPATGPVYALPFVRTTTSAPLTQTVSVNGENVSLSAPSQCVRNGLINSAVKVSLPSAKRKGKVVVKIYEVIFKVGGQTVTIKRKHLSDAPIKVTIHLAHVKPGTRLILTARAFIAVKHGPKRSKTLRLTLTSCAA